MEMPLPGWLAPAATHPPLEDLFRQHHATVLGLCLGLCRSRADAEDAVQETFLAVQQALPSFRGEAQLSTWLHRIALRSALAVRARRGAVEEAGDDGRTVDPHRQSDARLALEPALATLPLEHRAVLALFAVQGLTHREIAEILGVPEGTVWSRLHAARRRLVAHLDR
jgi:RNA polymerase sigma-70 factor (ECF subfamily)